MLITLLVLGCLREDLSNGDDATPLWKEEEIEERSLEKTGIRWSGLPALPIGTGKFCQHKLLGETKDLPCRYMTTQLLPSVSPLGRLAVCFSNNAATF